MDPRFSVVGMVGLLLAGGVTGIARSAEPLTPDEGARYADLDARLLQTFTNADLADYVALRSQDCAARGRTPDPAEEIGRCATKGLGQHFRLNAARFDYTEGDCVVFVERAIAISLATDWASYYKLCERLRHKHGEIGFFDRNFFTLADWVPSNTAWLLRDVTGELGVPTAEFVDVVRRQRFLAKVDIGREDSAAGRTEALRAAKIASAPEREARTHRYIPRDAVPATLPRLQTGDVVLVIRRRQSPGLKPWLDCDHMGLVVVNAGGVVTMLHCAPGIARQARLTQFLARFNFVEGFKFLRLRDGARGIAAKAIEETAFQPRVPTPGELDEKIAGWKSSR